MTDLTDSAGNVRTEEQVRAMARETMRDLSGSAIFDLLIEGFGSIEALPPDMTRCDCHGLWYDECELYR